MTWFIVGDEDRLDVTETPPRIVTLGGGLSLLWDASTTGARYQFRIKRGAAEEFRLPWEDQKRVLARVLPSDVEPEMRRLNEDVEKAEAALKKARAARRGFLVAEAPRGRVVRETDGVRVARRLVRGDDGTPTFIEIATSVPCTGKAARSEAAERGASNERRCTAKAERSEAAERGASHERGETGKEGRT